VARKPGAREANAERGRRPEPDVEHAGAGFPATGLAADVLAVDREPESIWPGWAKGVATALIVLHIAAVVSGALGVPPSSELERRVANAFTWYHGLMDQGYAYRYYAEPPPTPVVLANLSFSDGRPDEEVRIPALEVPGPPMRRQRQLAVANALFSSVQAERRRPGGDRDETRLARSYARRLCQTHPGCSSVTLRLQQHLIPDPRRVLEALEQPGHGPFDLFDSSLLTTPRWIGDFPCDGF
jgi:hypothetical protein